FKTQHTSINKQNRNHHEERRHSIHNFCAIIRTKLFESTILLHPCSSAVRRVMYQLSHRVYGWNDDVFGNGLYFVCESFCFVVGRCWTASCWCDENGSRCRLYSNGYCSSRRIII